jgi:hypothetical protein
MQTITGVPPERVGQVVQDFVDDGATHIVVTREVDGTFTVSGA